MVVGLGFPDRENLIAAQHITVDPQVINARVQVLVVGYVAREVTVDTVGKSDAEHVGDGALQTRSGDGIFPDAIHPDFGCPSRRVACERDKMPLPVSYHRGTPRPIGITNTEPNATAIVEPPPLGIVNGTVLFGADNAWPVPANVAIAIHPVGIDREVAGVCCLGLCRLDPESHGGGIGNWIEFDRIDRE